MPIPDQDPIDNLYGTKTSIRLELNFDSAITNSALPHILVSIAKVKRNERFKRMVTTNIGTMFRPTSDFKIHVTFNAKNKTTKILQYS